MPHFLGILCSPCSELEGAKELIYGTFRRAGEMPSMTIGKQCSYVTRIMTVRSTLFKEQFRFAAKVGGKGRESPCVPIAGVTQMPAFQAGFFQSPVHLKFFQVFS